MKYLISSNKSERKILYRDIESLYRETEDSMKSTFSVKMTAVQVSINARLSSDTKYIIRGKTSTVQLDASLRIFLLNFFY